MILASRTIARPEVQSAWPYPACQSAQPDQFPRPSVFMELRVSACPVLRLSRREPSPSPSHSRSFSPGAVPAATLGVLICGHEPSTVRDGRKRRPSVSDEPISPAEVVGLVWLLVGAADRPGRLDRPAQKGEYLDVRQVRRRWTRALPRGASRLHVDLVEPLRAGIRQDALAKLVTGKLFAAAMEF